MTTYICKCGRQVKKATNADNTGNRDTKGCKGCPYLLPWGPDKYIEGQGYTKDVQGYECRMSPTISYTTTYRGQANDKCTLHILSLDLDFLDEVQAWIYDNAADTLSAGFSRGSMRGIDFSDKGRYSLSISCTQNKKGMAAKAALLDRFFTGGRVRKDKTLVQEKAHILAAIKEGKENASKMNYIISQHDNGLLYAYYLGTFWFWLADKRWVPSDFAKQEYEKAQKKNPRITPEEFMDSDDFIQMDDYEVPSQKLSALKALTTADSKISVLDEEEGVLRSSNEPPEIVDECSEPDCMCKTCGRESCFAHGCAKECPANAEESCLTVACPEYIEKAIENPTAAAVDAPPCAPIVSDAQTLPYPNADAGAKTGAEESVENPTPAAPASRADVGAAEQSLSAAGHASLEAKDMNVPSFDYNGLDDQTVADLHLAEREYMSGRKLAEVGLRRMADGVAMAHDALCGTDTTICRNGDGTFSAPEKTFGRWCDSVGLNRKAAERLLQVARLFDNSTPREEKVLEELGPSLLYAAAKPSAPAELVQAVKDGDITTHKQYQAALARIRTLENQNASLLHSYETERGKAEAADRRAEEEQRKRKEADEGCASAMETLRQAQEDAASADARARAAENRADGAEKLAELRGTENTELKAKIREMENQPRDVAVIQPGEDQIEAWRQEGADRMAATMQETVSKVNQEKQKVQNQVIDLQKQLEESRPDADACQRTVDILYETTENLRLLLRSQLKQAQLSPNAYGKVVAHVLQAAHNLMDTVRVCAPDGYDMDSEEDDDFE